MATRSGTDYLIAEVRRLTGAGTAEYTIVHQSGGTVTYFTDEQIEQILDSRRVRLSRHQMVFEPELSTGGGTTVYKHARVGYGWLEAETAGGTTSDFQITDSQGSIIGTANYTLSAEDGWISYATDQNGSARYITCWAHNPYKAAVDILSSWLSELSRHPDFQTDNMRVWRSQKAKMIRDQIADLKELAGMAPQVQVTYLDRSDISPSPWP